MNLFSLISPQRIKQETYTKTQSDSRVQELRVRKECPLTPTAPTPSHQLSVSLDCHQNHLVLTGITVNFVGIHKKKNSKNTPNNFTS